MKITRKHLRNLIETFLQEVDAMSPGVDIMMPGSGRSAPGLPSGVTPFPKPRDPEGEIPDDIVLGAEILLGFTPVGVAVDFKDLAIAIEDNDPALAIAAGIGFIPVIGDLFKIPYKGTVTQAKYLRQLEKELGPEGIEKIRKKTSTPSKVAVKAVRSIRVLEPNIVLDANDDFRKAVYPIAVDSSEYVVTLIKRSYGAPVQVSFNVPGAEAFKMTGQGNVMRVVDGVFETVKDFNKRFPGEKSFSFTGAVQGGPRPSPGEATKRARVFSGLLQRKISRDPELAAMVKKIRDASWAGDANTWKIDLHELRKIIKEELGRLWEQAKDFVCPEPTQDLELNTKNRNSAIEADYIQYGPLNLSDEAYWERAAEHWKTTPDVAKDSRCYNCVAFDISPRMQECMPGEIMSQEEIEEAIENDESWETLGYCWMHSFKCHSDRTCYTWAAGGPIVEDEASHDWQERNTPETV